jgi:hypothetical protein
MRVKCIDGSRCGGNIINGKEYENIEQSDDDYYCVIRETDKIRGLYYKSRFKIVEGKPMKKIIKDWHELHGIELDDGFEIDSNEAYMETVYIQKIPNGWIIPLRYDMGNDRIIKILAVFGLDVEFAKEPTITQNDYNWLVALNIPEQNKIRKSHQLVTINGNLVMYSDNILNGLEKHKEFTVSDILKMKVVD